MHHLQVRRYQLQKIQSRGEQHMNDNERPKHDDDKDTVGALHCRRCQAPLARQGYALRCRYIYNKQLERPLQFSMLHKRNNAPMCHAPVKFHRLHRRVFQAVGFGFPPRSYASNHPGEHGSVANNKILSNRYRKTKKAEYQHQ